MHHHLTCYVILICVAQPAWAKGPEPGEEAAAAEVYAGSLLGLDGVADALAEQIAQTQARHLVWKGKVAVLGRRKHTFDWNPALAELHKRIDRDVPGWIDEALEQSAALWKENKERKQDRREEALAQDFERIATTIEVAAAYLGCIRASHYALHDRPSLTVGAIGFTNGLIELTDRLWEVLEQGRKKPPLGWREEAVRQAGAAQAYVEQYFDGLEEGRRLLKGAEVAGLVSLGLGVGEALLGLRALLGQLVGSSGGAGMVAAGGGGATMILSGELAVETAWAMEAVVRGGAKAMLTGVLMRGGRGPVEVGRAGERAAGMPDKKKRIEWPGGSGRYIVPDHVTELTIEEVKNVL